MAWIIKWTTQFEAPSGSNFKGAQEAHGSIDRTFRTTLATGSTERSPTLAKKKANDAAWIWVLGDSLKKLVICSSLNIFDDDLNISSGRTNNEVGIEATFSTNGVGIVALFPTNEVGSEAAFSWTNGVGSSSSRSGAFENLLDTKKDDLGLLKRWKNGFGWIQDWVDDGRRRA